MKALASLLFLSSIGLAQEPSKSKIITFNQTDTEHCKVVLVDGNPMLQTTYNGTSVAIAMPRNYYGLRFAVVVRISYEGEGRVEVKPKNLSVISSDPGHTRFLFVDVERMLKDAQTPGPIFTADNAGSPYGNTSAPMEGAWRWAYEANGAHIESPSTNTPKKAERLEFLHRKALHHGDQTEGVVYFEKPKGSNANVSPNSLPDEIDIPIENVLFRF